MTTQYVSETQGKLTHSSDSGRWDCRSLGAIIGMAGGIMVAFLGSLLTFGSWFMRGEIGRFEHVAGTVLLFLTIPLLVLGAHCLDLVERRKKGAEVTGSESRQMATKNQRHLSKKEAPIEIKRAAEQAGVLTSTVKNQNCAETRGD